MAALTRPMLANAVSKNAGKYALRLNALNAMHPIIHAGATHIGHSMAADDAVHRGR